MIIKCTFEDILNSLDCSCFRVFEKGDVYGKFFENEADNTFLIANDWWGYEVKEMRIIHFIYKGKEDTECEIYLK